MWIFAFLKSGWDPKRKIPDAPALWRRASARDLGLGLDGGDAVELRLEARPRPFFSMPASSMQLA
jgi:hypothetical protein